MSSDPGHLAAIAASRADGELARVERVRARVGAEVRRALGAPGPGVRLLSTREAAEVLGASPQSVRAWIRSGDLPATRVGSHGEWRISSAVLDRIIGAASTAREESE